MIQPSIILSKLVNPIPQRTTHGTTHGSNATLCVGLLLALLLLMGCQPIQAPSATPDATATPVAEEEMAQPTLPPTLLRIPDLSLELPITPMGWQVTEANGQRTTQWLVPVDTVGWQVDSAAAGATGPGGRTRAGIASRRRAASAQPWRTERRGNVDGGI